MSLPDLRLKVEFGQAWERDIRLLQRRARIDILTRLAEHKSIIDYIMQYCFPGSSIHIYEYPRWTRELRDFKLREREKPNKTSYMAEFNYEEWETSYFGSLQPETPTRTIPPTCLTDRGVGHCTGLLRVNKRMCTIARKCLYARDLHLQCSAQGARTFMMAHRKDVRLVKQLVLYFYWKDDNVVVSTNLRSWNLLLQKLRHEFSFITNVRLHIGRSFWKLDSLFLERRPVSSGWTSPLYNATKFAAPAGRWEFKGNESTHRTDGTILHIHIEGTETQKQIDFVRELTDEIEKKRDGRPLFVRLGGKEIVYRCAGRFRRNR